MNILINGMPAVLKKGTSFDFISENRLFSGADSYTLSITFPLKDCPENEAIFGPLRFLSPENPVSEMIFDCEIRDRSFVRSGAITVISIEEGEVKTQFLEGRSVRNFDKTFDNVYINEISIFGAFKPNNHIPATTTPEAAWSASPEAAKGDFFTSAAALPALPWVIDSSGSLQNGFTTDINGESPQWDAKTRELNKFSCQFYLLRLVKAVIYHMRYTCDLSEWENDAALSGLLVCNTLPAAWDIDEPARALPHWTVAEFFEKLEHFLNCEFDINHKLKSVSFRKARNVAEIMPERELTEIIDDEWSMQISVEDPKCDYMDADRFRYNFGDSTPETFYSAPWFIENARTSGVETREWDSFAQLVSGLSGWAWTFYKPWTEEGNDGNRLHRASYLGLDLYHIIRTVDSYTPWAMPDELKPDELKPEYDEDGNQVSAGRRAPVFINILQPVNPFGGKYFKEGEEPDYIDIDFLPVPVDWTDINHGMVMFLPLSGYSETEYDDDNESGIDTSHSWASVSTPPCGKAETVLKAGAKERQPEYYSKIYLGWHGSSPAFPELHPMVYPARAALSKTDIPVWQMQYTHKFTPRTGGFDFRLESIRPRDMMPEIDKQKKLTLKFLSDDIPDPRGLFNIRGRRYICEKITATISEDGLSRLMKGEFWPLIER